jgi:hypothetical protein
VSIENVQVRDLKPGAKKPISRDATGLGLNLRSAPNVPGADSGANPDEAVLREVEWTLESKEPCDGAEGRYYRPGDYELRWVGRSNDGEVDPDPGRSSTTEVRHGHDFVTIATGAAAKAEDVKAKAEQFGAPVPAPVQDKS